MKINNIKRILIICLIIISSSNFVIGQFSYTFTAVGGSFTANSSPTTIHAAGVDDALSSAINIGFTFNYACNNYTQIKVSSNGWLTFNTAVTASNASNNLNTSSDRPVIAPLWDDIEVAASPANINYQLTGTAPNRVLTVEWNRMHWNYTGTTWAIAFQCKLYETTNVIEFIYLRNGNATANIAGTASASIGISGTTSGQFYSLDGVGASPTASTVTETTTLSSKPATGQIYRWTPAASCSGTPNAGTATPSPSSVCSGGTSTITLTGYSTGCGISYQWQSSPDNSVWSNISGATSTSYLATVTAQTYYRCITTCSNGGGTNTSSVATVTMNSPTLCYCSSGATSTSDEDIFNVTMGTLNNSSNCSTTGGAGSILNRYSNYTGVAAPNLQQGSTVAYSVQVGTCGGSYSNGVAIWIDYNQDGDFNDAGEKVYNSASTTSGAHTESGNIVIPLTATLGNTGMRVICTESSVPTDPCSSYSWGETEDYIVNITAAPACSGTPTAGTASASPASYCVPGSSTLSLTGYSVGSGITFQWQSAPAAGGPWTNISGATSTSYIASPTVTTYYRCVVTCTNSGLSANTAAVTVTVNGPSYATLPYSQGFEGPWVSRCDTREVPDNYWSNYPFSGNNSWRRHDDGIAAAGWTSNTGLYSPVSSQGSYSAEFNSYSASSGTTGDLDLYVDMSPVGTKTLFFDYINPGTVTADDKMEVLLSTDGGLTFPTTLLTLPAPYTSWTTQSVDISSNSSTCVIRFHATSDYGSSGENTGIDNLSIVLPCSGTPTAGTASANNLSFCNSTSPLLTVSGYSMAGGITFQWQASTTNSPYAWVNLTGGNTATFSAPSISQTTYYRCEVSCGANSAYTNILTITNTAQSITSTNNPVSIVCGNTANLTATASGGASIKWYSASTGGVSLFTGSPYTTPALTANTTYYCAASNGSSTEYGGMPTKSSSTGYLSTGLGVVFDATQTFTLNSVTIYPQGTGTVTIQLQDNTGTPLNTTAAIATNGNGNQARVIPLGFAVPIGTGYRLVLSAYTGITDLIRDFTTAFPYPSPSGAINVTSGWWAGTTSTNYYMYNLEIAIGCESSPRTPVNVTVTGVSAPVCSGYTSPANGSTGICPVSTTLNWAASNTACRVATSYKLYFGTNAAATNIINGTDIGNVLSYNLGTLSGSTTYYWKIVPTNAGGDASGCSIWSFTTAANPGSICPGLLGGGVTSVASLPYASGAGTTSGAGNDLTSANLVTCGSTSYTTGEDRVWYFTPATSGNVNINLTSTGTYTGITVFDGCPLAAGACGAAPGSCIGYSQSSTGNESLSVCVVAGTTYYIVLDSWSTPFNNPYSNLTISTPSGVLVPPNDLPCNAEALTLGAVANGDNSCSSSASEPLSAPSCWTTGIRNTVWYSVIAPASGQLSVKTNTSGLSDTQIALYQGSCGSLTQVAPTSSSCNNDMSGCGSTYASSMTVTGLTPGNTYYIVVDGAYDLTGTFSIEAIDPSTQSFPVVPGQDCSLPLPTCAEIISISDPGYSNTGNICDFDGTNNCTSGERASVWYTIDIGNTGTLQFDIIPNDYDGTVGSETDYDFLVWRIAGTGVTTNCAGIAANPGNALVACNFSALGVTGLYPGGNGNPVFNGGTPWDGSYEAPVSVTAGDQYLIVIQNYTQSTSGFTIDYTGSTPGCVNISATPTLVAWTGASNTSWANAGNWGGCGIPSCNTSAVIPSYMSNMPVISANASVKDLTINPGATLTLNAGIKLTICGNFTNNGTFVLGAGSIVEFAGTAAQTCINNSGTLTIPNVIINNTSTGVTLVGGTLSNMIVSGTFTFTNGILHTSNPPMLIMDAGSTVSGSSATRFVDGPMQKIGSTAFIFPLGDGSRWARLGIAPTASTTFQAEYFYSGYSSTSLCVTPTPVLAGISSIEYWQLDRVAGTGNSAVTLYWEDAASSGITSCAAPPAGDLSVARYTGACWENKNITGGSVTGSCAGSSAGTITSDVITSFSPFTFSSKTAPLPVELLSFTGKSETGYNILHWTTITEINNDYFSLEKSSDGINFTELAVIKGAENSSSPINYNYKDMDPFYLDTYYRLKQVDLNGKFKYSNIVVISNDYNDKVSDFIDLFPNPASTIINLRFSSSYEANAEITICDYSGRILIDEERKIQIGNDQLTFDIDNLSKGVYYLKVNFTETGKTCYKRFIKN